MMKGKDKDWCINYIIASPVMIHTCISARWLVCFPCSRSATFLHMSEHTGQRNCLYGDFSAEGINYFNKSLIKFSTLCVCVLTEGGGCPSTRRCQLEHLFSHYVSSSRLCKRPRRLLQKWTSVALRMSFPFLKKPSIFKSCFFFFLYFQKTSNILTHVCETVCASWRRTFRLFDSFGVRLCLLLLLVTSLPAEGNVLQGLRTAFGKKVSSWLHALGCGEARKSWDQTSAGQPALRSAQIWLLLERLCWTRPADLFSLLEVQRPGLLSQTPRHPSLMQTS